MTHPLCLLRAIWRSLFRPGTLVTQGIPMEGHAYREEYNGPAYVSVLKCECCGKYSVGWSREPMR